MHDKKNTRNSKQFKTSNTINVNSENSNSTDDISKKISLNNKKIVRGMQRKMKMKKMQKIDLNCHIALHWIY